MHSNLQYTGCCKTSGQLRKPITDALARSEKTLKNLFLEKIIIPGQKSVPFYVIKEVQ